MLPKPTGSNKSKRSKRMSAPPKTLGNTLPPLKEPTLNKSKSKDDNLFDLLDFGTNNNTNNQQTNNTSNPFEDFFDNNTSNVNNNNNNNNKNNLSKPRMSVNTQIYNQLQNVWDDFSTKDSPIPQNNNDDKDDFFNLFSDNVNKSTNITQGLGIIGEDDKEDMNTNDNKQNNQNGNDNGDDNNNDDDDEDDEDDDDDEDKDNNNNNSNNNDNKNTSNTNNDNKTNNVKEDTKNVSSKKGTNALEELWRGTALLKYPRRHGFPHFKYIQLSSDNTTVQWFSKKKTMQQTCILIKDIREVRKGQETEVFRKFHQEALERASFSVVFGYNYKTLDLVAKSTEECEMWVKTLQELVKKQRNGEDITKLKYLDVGVKFRDRNRPKSRSGGSGRFIRSNESKTLKIDTNSMKQLEKDMEKLHTLFNKITKLAKDKTIVSSSEYKNVSKVLSELEERIEELSHEVHNTRDTEMSKRDVWRANVDLSAVEEKLIVLKSINKKRSSIFG